MLFKFLVLQRMSHQPQPQKAHEMLGLFKQIYLLTICIAFTSAYAFAQESGGLPMPEPVQSELLPPNSAEPKPLNNFSGRDYVGDLFYDSNDLVPASEMTKDSGPRKVNPVDQPGAKYIIVRKNSDADSREAKLVSAERAMALGRYDSALAIFEELYAKNKRDPNILLGRATAFQKLDMNEHAIKAYEELLELRPNNIEAQTNMLGLLGREYPSVALRRLLDLREKNPRDVRIASQIAVIQAELGNYDDALKYLGMAAGLEPENAAHLYNMAVIVDRNGMKKDAVKYYEQALEVDTIYGGGRTIPRDDVFERLARLR